MNIIKTVKEKASEISDAIILITVAFINQSLLEHFHHFIG